MWETQIIQFIKEKAESIPQIQEVFMHPTGMDIIEVVEGVPTYKGTRIKKYPALVFAKDTFDNEFSDTGANHLTINFIAWVVVNAENIDGSDLFERILPNASDSVLDVFNKGWDFGTINGHRVWARMASGIQGYTPEQSGRQAWVEMRLVVRLDIDVV
jgi:hypothetical protein